MDKAADFLSKLKYPTLFVIIGAAFLVFATAQTLNVAGAQITPYSAIARGGAAIIGASFVLIGLYLVLRDGKPTRPKVAVRYDLFLAAPMAATETDAEYAEFRQLCLEVLAALRAYCGVKSVYFVGEKLHSRADFESNKVAAELDFDAIRQSARFVMVYPRKLVSSVLSEAGFALAEGLPSVYFVRSETDLPYLLAQAGELPSERFPKVHVQKYDTTESLTQIIRNDGAHLFPAA